MELKNKELFQRIEKGEKRKIVDKITNNKMRGIKTAS